MKEFKGRRSGLLERHLKRYEKEIETIVNKSEPVSVEVITTGIVKIKIPARVLRHIIDKGYIKVKNGMIVDVLC